MKYRPIKTSAYNDESAVRSAAVGSNKLVWPRLATDFLAALVFAATVQGLARPAFGADDPHCLDIQCRNHIRGTVFDNASADLVATGANTERETAMDIGHWPVGLDS